MLIVRLKEKITEIIVVFLDHLSLDNDRFCGLIKQLACYVYHEVDVRLPLLLILIYHKGTGHSFKGGLVLRDI